MSKISKAIRQARLGVNEEPEKQDSPAAQAVRLAAYGAASGRLREQEAAKAQAEQDLRLAAYGAATGRNPTGAPLSERETAEGYLSWYDRLGNVARDANAAQGKGWQAPEDYASTWGGVKQSAGELAGEAGKYKTWLAGKAGAEGMSPEDLYNAITGIESGQRWLGNLGRSIDRQGEYYGQFGSAEEMAAAQAEWERTHDPEYLSDATGERLKNQLAAADEAFSISGGKAGPEKAYGEALGRYNEWQRNRFDVDAEKSLAGLSRDELEYLDYANDLDRRSANPALPPKERSAEDMAAALNSLRARFSDKEIRQLQEYREAQNNAAWAQAQNASWTYLSKNGTPGLTDLWRSVLGETYLDPYLTEEQLDDVAAGAAKTTAGTLASAYSVALAPAKALGNIEALRGILPEWAGGYADPNRPTDVNSPWFTANRTQQTIRSAVSENMSEVGRFAYNTLMSAADSALNMALGSAVGRASWDAFGAPNSKIAATLFGDTLQSRVANTVSWIMGSEVAADTVMEEIQNGRSNWEALGIGIVRGLFEHISEKYSVENILKTPGRWYQRLRKAFVSEGAEEVASNWMNRVFDVLVLHQSDVTDRYNELRAGGMDEAQALAVALVETDGEAFLAGGLSGLGMSGVADVSGVGPAIRTGRQLTTGQTVTELEVNGGTVTVPPVDEATAGLIESGLESPEGTESRELAETLLEKAKAGKTISAEETGRLAQANDAAFGRDGAEEALREAMAQAEEAETKKDAAARPAAESPQQSGFTAAERQMYQDMTRTANREGPVVTDTDRAAERVAGRIAEEEAARTSLDRAAESSDLGENGRAYLRSLYTGGDTGSYFGGFLAYYNAGMANENADAVSTRRGETLTPEQRQAAWNAGRMDAVWSIRDNGKAVTAKEPGYVRDAMAKKANPTAKEERYLDVLGKATGTRIVFGELDGDTNAEYDAKTATITVNVKAQDPVIAAATHEIVHRVRDMDPQAYRALRDFVVQNLSDERLQMSSALRSKIYETSDVGYYTEELVADAFGRMAQDRGILEDFVREHRTAAQRFLDAIRDVIDRVKRFLRTGGESRQLTEGQRAEFEELLDRLTLAQATLEEALGERTAETGENGGIVMKDGVAMPADVASKVEGDVKPVDYMDDDAVRQSMYSEPDWAKNYRAMGGEERVLRVIHQFTEDMLGNDVIHDYVPHGVVKYDAHGPLRSNIEYIITFDMDASCPRTFQFLNYRNRLMRIAGRPLTFNESIQLMELMRAYGQQVPCTYCYVENKRILMASSYLNWFDFHSAVLAAETDEEARTQMYSYNAKNGTLSDAAEKVFAEWRNGDRSYRPGAAEVWTAVQTAKNSVFNWLDNGSFDRTGRKSLVDSVCRHFGVKDKLAKSQVGDFVDDWIYDRDMKRPHDYAIQNNEDVSEVDQRALAMHRTAMSYAKSASSARVVDNYVPYTDQFKNITAAQREKINAQGGVRKHSSNDFRIDYVQDYFLFFADLALNRMYGHTYTKNGDYVRIFGRTGDRINISVAFDEVDGKIIENKLEGMLWKEAQQLRKDYYENVGVMAMVTSDAQLSYALNADWVDMIIPFHASGLKKEVWYNLKMWSDYTSKQNERWYTRKDMERLLAEKGVEVPKSATAEEVKALFEQNFEIKKIINEKGEIVKPHFLPGEYTVNGQTVPGHHNDKETYLRLCREYGVNPRFNWVMVDDGNGNQINVVDHPNYMKLVKETARTETEQKPIQFNLDEVDPKLGMSPMDYAMKRMQQEAENGGFGNLSDDPYHIVDEFRREYLGKDKPLPAGLDTEGKPLAGNLEDMLTERARDFREQLLEMQAEDAERQAKILRQSFKATKDLSVRKSRVVSDADYMAAVERGDMETARRMVDEAAKEWGAETGKNGKPLILYHGTPAFGFTKFGTDAIFTTPDRGVAAGYGGGKGYADARGISEQYIPDDGTDDTLIQNVKNILHQDAHTATKADLDRVKAKISQTASELSAAASDAWDYGDGFPEMPSDVENGLSYLLTLPGEITGTIDELFSGDYPASEIRSTIEGIKKYREATRSWFSEHRDEIKATGNEALYRMVLGFDLTDFAIDVEYSLLPALDSDKYLVGESGGFSSKENLRDRVEQAKNLGAYSLYGNIGDNPLVIDAKGAFWASVPAPMLGSGTMLTDDIVRKAKAAGYTSLVIKNVMDPAMNNYSPNRAADDYVFFTPDSVKSADPVTYDDDGKVIPLSERFNPAEEDIRRSRSTRGAEVPLNEGVPVADRGSADASQVEELRRTADALAKENERLRKRVDYWKEQTKRTQGLHLRPGDVKRVTEQLLKDYSSEADADETRQNIGKLAMLLRSRPDVLSYDDLMNVAREVAAPVVQNARELVNADEARDYRDFKKWLRGGKISISRGDAGWIPDFAAWKKAHSALRVGIDNGGLPIDTAYSQLSERFPGFFPQDIINPTDQLERIAEVLDTWGPVFENPYSPYMAAAIDEAAMDILERVMDEDTVRPTPPTAADRAQAALDEQKERNVWDVALARSEERVKGERALADEKARGKAALDDQRQRAAWNVAQRVAQERAKRDRMIASIKQHQAEVKQNERNRRQESQDRDRLLRVARRLQRLKTTEANREIINALIGDLDTVSKGLTTKSVENLVALRDWYAGKVTPDSPDYDPDFIADKATLKKLERLSKRQIADLTITEVRELTEALLNIENQIRTARQLIDSEDRRDVYYQALDIAQHMEDAKGWKKGLVSGMLSPERFARRVTGYAEGDPLQRAMAGLSAGQRTMWDYQRRALQDVGRWAGNREFMRRWSGKDAQRIRIDGDDGLGHPVTATITPGMLASLYLHSMNDDNMKHVAKGGVTIPNAEAYRKGDYENAYRNATTMRLQRSQIQRLAQEHLSAEDRAFIRAIMRYFNETSKAALGETAEKLLGYSPFNVDRYFPISVDQNFLHTDFNSMGDDGSVKETLADPGYAQERKQDSKPIYLRDANDVLADAIRKHSQYVGLAIPVRNVNKLIKTEFGTYTEEGERVSHTGSLKKTLNDTFGKAAMDYLNQLMKDVQGNRTRDNSRLGELLSALRSNYAGAVLTLNAGVAIKQAASYPTAAAVLKYRHLARALKYMAPGVRVDTDLIQRYTPLLWYRSLGYSSQEQGELQNRGKPIPKKLNWIQAMDVKTTAALWKAAEYQIAEERKDLQRGSDGFYKAVAELYNRVIEETQPNYSVMQRPEILRTTNELTKTLNMFKTQPFQNFNILYDAVGDWQAQRRAYSAAANDEARAEARKRMDAAKRKLGRALSSQLISSLVFALMQYAWDAFRRKDDKYKDKEGNADPAAWLKGIGLNMLGNGFGMLPFGSELLEWGEALTDKLLQNAGGDPFFEQKFYGFDASVLETMTNLATGASSLIARTVQTIQNATDSEKKTDWEAMGREAYDAAVNVSQALGIPVENVRKTLTAVAERVLIRAAGPYLGEYYAMRIADEPKSGNSRQYYDLLYRAMENDKAAYEELYKLFIDDGSGLFTHEKIRENMEKRMKAAQGVNSVTDLAERYEGTGYMSAEQQKRYDELRGPLTRSPLWREATKEQRGRVEDRLYQLAAETSTSSSAGTKLQAKIDEAKEAGISEGEYMLYLLAMSMADEPSKTSGEYGTYTNDEQEAALDMLDGLSREDKSWLWMSTHDSDKNNPYK